jgi:hypothetical protein
MRTNRKPLLLGVLAGLTALTACARPDDTPADADAPSTEPQEAFWSALHSVCDGAFAGSVEVAPAGDTTFANRELVMHGRECSDDEIRIPFHVGEDRSRTWVITRTDTGLRLKHDHRHEDGSPDALTMYGGDTATPGTAGRQEFPVDAESTALFERQGLTASMTNTWAIELEPGQRYVYELARPGRLFRVEFDLTKPVAPPPPPWGSDAAP